MKVYRGKVTVLGKALLVFLAAMFLAALVVDHMAPRIGMAAAAVMLATSYWNGHRLRNLEPIGLAPGRVIEGQARCLDLQLQYAGRGLLAFTFGLRSDHFNADQQGHLQTRSDTPYVPVLVHGSGRGRSRQAIMTWETDAPFGLIRYRCAKSISCDLWVLPAAREIRESLLEEMLTLRPKGLDLPQPTGPGEGEF